MGSGRLRMMQLSLKFTQHRVEQVIRVQLRPILNRVDGLYAGSRTVYIRNRHCTIEGDNGRVVHLRPLIIKGQYSWPIRGSIVLSQAMASGDAGLNMVLAQFHAGGRLSQVKDTPFDHWPAPFGTFLLF